MSSALEGPANHPPLDPENPWPGLDSFRESDAEFFRGREAASEELLRLVRRERLTVLHGMSGLGKSSLLQAGLFPALRDERMFAIYIRLVHDPHGQPLREQVLATVAAAARAEGVETAPQNPAETLWEHFHRHGATYWSANNLPVIPVLAFDQFEEMFSLDDHSPERAARTEAFLEELGDLIEGRVPATVRTRLEAGAEDPRAFAFRRHPYKVVITLREDFLAELEALAPRIPSIVVNRMRLAPLNGAEALAVTMAGGTELVPDDVGERIVRLVAASPDPSRPLGRMVVDPALLSLFCRELNERRKSLGQREITRDLVEGNRASILADFYERSVADLDPGVRAFVEERLLTVGGYRNTEALENALAMPGVTPEAIDVLVGRRVIRGDDRDGRTRIELTHDVLTDVIAESRRRRRAEDELTRTRAEAERQRQAALAAARQFRRARALAGLMAALLLAVLALSAFAWRERASARRSAVLADYREAIRYAEAGESLAALAWLARVMEQAPDHVAGRSLAFAILQDVYHSTARSNHPDTLKGVTVSRDRTRVATISRNSAARVWDVATGAPIGPPLRERRGVRSIAFSPDSRLVVTTSDTHAQVWEIASGTRRGQALMHANGVSAASFSPDGRRVVTGSFDHTAQVWDAETGAKIGVAMQHADGVVSAVFSPDGSRVATASFDSTARVWRATTGSPVGPYLLHEGRLEGVVFSPGGDQILTKGRWGQARIWDAETGRPVGAPLLATGSTRVSDEGNPGAPRFGFSPDGRLVAMVREYRTVEVRDARTGEPVLPPLQHSDEVLSVQFSGDSRRLVTGSVDQTARVWDLETGKVVGIPLRHATAVVGAFFGTAGHQVITVSLDGTIETWVPGPGARVGPPLVHGTPVVGASFGADGRRVVTAGTDGVVHAWDASIGRELSRRRIVTAGTDGALYTRDTSAERQMSAIALSPTGTRLGLVSRPMRAMNAFERQPPLTRIDVWDAATGARIGSTSVRDVVFHLSFSHNGQWIVTSSAFNDGIQVWNPESGSTRTVPTGRGPSLSQAALSTDGTRLVTFDGPHSEVWDASTGRRLAGLVGSAGVVSSAAFSFDARRVVTAGFDGTVQVWDARTGQRLGPVIRHTNRVLSAAFSPEGRWVVTASADGTAQVWDAATGARIGPSLQHAAIVQSAVFSPDGQRVLTVSVDSTVRVWDTRTGTSQESRDLAEFVAAAAGVRIDDNGALISIPDSTSDALMESYRRRARTDGPGPAGSLAEFLRRFFGT